MRPVTDLHVDLTDAQVEAYREDGFLAIDRITTDEEVEWLGGVYDRLFAERTGEAEGKYFDLAGPRAHAGREVLPQVLGPERIVPELRETIYFRNARALAARLLGLPLEEVNGGGHMILKPAGYGRETPWHQDEAYWNPDLDYQSLSVWLPLNPATLESGCMQFIPGSHRRPLVPHRHIDDDPLVHGLITDEADASAAVACPIPAGGATFHDRRTLHYAGPNTTDEVRRAYTLIMRGATTKRETPYERPWMQQEQDALVELPGLSRPRPE